MLGNALATAVVGILCLAIASLMVFRNRRFRHSWTGWEQYFIVGKRCTMKKKKKKSREDGNTKHHDYQCSIGMNNIS
jgi:hypothetical protein